MPHVEAVHHAGSSRADPVMVEWHKARGFLYYFRKQFHGLRYLPLLVPLGAGIPGPVRGRGVAVAASPPRGGGSPLPARRRSIRRKGTASLHEPVPKAHGKPPRPGRAPYVETMLRRTSVRQPQQVFAVAGLAEAAAERGQLFTADPAVQEGESPRVPRYAGFWRFSMVRTKLAASTRLSWVPASNQANPRPSRSTRRPPRSR